MIQLRELCDKYGRDRSLTRKAMIRLGVTLHNMPEYAGGQSILWIHENDVPMAVAYLTKASVAPAASPAPAFIAGEIVYEPGLV